jgi:hypothetical protein
MMIKEVESKLEDFFEGNDFSSRVIVKKRFAALINSQGKDYRKDLFLDKKGVLRQKSKMCQNPECRSANVIRNGFHESGSFILEKLGMSLKVGQFECIDCGFRWSIDANEIYKLLGQFKEQIRNLAVEIKSNKTSLIKTAEIIESAVGKKYSHMSVSRWYKSRTSIMQEPTILNEICSGYYAYDEQEVSAGGKRFQRLTLRDLMINQPVAEGLALDKSEESIQGFLVRSLQDKAKKALIVDGDTMYPNIIINDLKMDYQLDIGHLFVNIKKAFKEECGYTVGRKRLHLADELKKQEIFDIFYPRKELLAFVKRGLEILSKIRDPVAKEEKDVELQKQLLGLKLERRKARRRKGHVSEHKNYTLSEARKKFEFVKTLYQFYPKSVQKLIDRIEKDWKHYILFLIDRNVPPTSNYIEQYYSSTLQWSDKKEFRNKEQLNEFIRLERIKKAGIFSELLTKTGLNFIELIGVFVMTFLGC